MRTRRMTSFFSVLCLSAVTGAAVLLRPASAIEVDNFTEREALKTDALPALDAKVNLILSRAARQANRDSPDRCNRVMLRQEIVRWTGPDPMSVLEMWAALTDEVNRSPITFSKSIYAGASFGESPGMRVFGIGRSFRLAGHIVGTDKLGHFFMQGLDYFKRVELEGAPLEQVMIHENGEDGLWGTRATGVKSYADMAANYAGYGFWKTLYQGERPYFKCENNKRWVQQRPFSWAEYVTDAWDEAINCSELKPALAARVESNMRRIGVHCPIDTQRCAELNSLDHAAQIISPVCRSQASKTGSPVPL